MKQVRAPFTAEQVANINEYQEQGRFHPFTCGGEKCRETLVAHEDGLHCPKCDYRQFWVWDMMAQKQRPLEAWRK